MKFKVYLNENIITDKKFIKNIEKYVDMNDFKDLDFIIKNSEKIPAYFNKEDIFYRGMILTDEELDIVNNNNFKLNRVTSLTKDKNIAIKFATDPKYRIKNKQGTPVLITKKFKPIIDIDAYIQYMYSSDLLGDFDDLALDSAMKEKEVITPVLSILNKEIKKLK